MTSTSNTGFLSSDVLYALPSLDLNLNKFLLLHTYICFLLRKKVSTHVRTLNSMMVQLSLAGFWRFFTLLTVLCNVRQYADAYSPNEGNTAEQVADSRQPTLYTKDFGSCIRYPQVELTRFHAAYYKDNMTLVFHIQGQTKLQNQGAISEYHACFL